MDGRLSGQAWLYARRAPGNACLSGLRSGRMHTLDNVANPTSKGCGAVMRSAPFGLSRAWDADHAFDLAVRCAVQTHGHPTGYLAAGAFAAIIRHLLDGVNLDEAVRRVVRTLDRRTGGEETARALRTAVRAAAEGKADAERVEEIGGGWVAEEALAIAVYCALTHAEDVRSALLLAVNHSGDSDSTGAITGNLLGVTHGLSALPQAWVAALEGRETIERLVADFITSTHDGI